MTIILPQQKPAKPTPPAGILRGPADADAFRVKYGRYGERWYTDTLPADDRWPHSEWVGPSVSTVKKAKPFEGADYVAMKRIATALDSQMQPRTSGSLRSVIVPASYAAMYEHFKSLNKLGLDAAGKRGTHVHLMAEQMLYGQPVTQDGPGSHYYPALVDFFDAYQPELVGAEIVFLHRDLHDHGYGGTGDAIIRIEGQTALIDWKSRGEDGDHAAYAEEGAQIAAYARASYAVAAGDDGMAKRIEVPELHVGLIISVKPDGCRIYPVDLDKAASLWESLHGWWVARLTEKEPIGRPWPTKRATKVATPVPPAEVAAGGSPPAPARTPYVVPVATESAPVWTAKPSEEGGEVDAKTVKRLTEGFARRSESQKAIVTALLKQAQRAGVEFGQVAKNPTRRRFELGRAALWIVDHCTWGDLDKPSTLDEDLVRAAMRLVIGDVPPVEHAPLGALLGTFTADEAASLCLVLDGITAGTYVADYSTNSLLLRRAS